MFSKVSHFHPRIIFRGKCGSQPLELSPIRGSTLVSSSLACKCYPRVEVTDFRKHSSLLQYGKNTAVKYVIVQALGVFVFGGSCQPSLMIAGNARSLS